LGFASLVGWGSWASPALANGRFPLANQLVVDPKNPAHLVARTTFGILDTSDGGGTWTWICEDAVGIFGGEDPPIAVTADGSTIVASSTGLAVSRDGGCSWTRPPNPGVNRTGVDVTVNPTNPHEALSIEASVLDGVYSVFLVKTSDDGATWIDVGPLPAGFVAETLEMAPSNPDRVYVTGRIPSQLSALLRSDDGGQTWLTPQAIDLPAGATAYIGAVDPTYPDIVYVRAQVMTNTIGVALATRDAGLTWKQIWTRAGSVAGFALSSDGATIAVGGPDSGLDIADTGDLAFSAANTLGPSCLAWSGAKLFACAKEAVDGFSIGVSDDKGVHFMPVLHFTDITPRACGAATSASICASTWGPIARTIGIDAGADDAASVPVTQAEARPNVDAGGGWSCAFHPSRAKPRAKDWSPTWGLVTAAWSFAAALHRRRGGARLSRGQDPT
jgi:photosystem II stability/assembly factor-like uncharacterized protein